MGFVLFCFVFSLLWHMMSQIGSRWSIESFCLKWFGSKTGHLLSLNAVVRFWDSFHFSSFPQPTPGKRTAGQVMEATDLKLGAKNVTTQSAPKGKYSLKWHMFPLSDSKHSFGHQRSESATSWLAGIFSLLSDLPSSFLWRVNFQRNSFPLLSADHIPKAFENLTCFL